MDRVARFQARYGGEHQVSAVARFDAEAEALGAEIRSLRPRVKPAASRRPTGEPVAVRLRRHGFYI